MSFIAGRLAAGKEGAYFFQESKQAVGRIVSQKKLPSTPSQQPPPSSSSSLIVEQEAQADVLHEVLRHSLPPKIFHDPSASSSSSPYSASKWVLKSDPNYRYSISAEALNPLRAYLSLPQVTFGAKRWEIPKVENSVLASTANELRQDRHTPFNPEKLKAAAEGLAYVGKAFAIATAIIFGGATLVFGLAASKLELQSSDDIRAKGRDLVEPKLQTIREQLIPLKDWAENKSKKWHIEREEDVKQKPIVKELAKILGAKTSNSN
ncbi:uncharacterized protein LOC107417107 [Ziziphus jujuba]|uniref:Uncharacterized protein LOC107417107 n=1 Tax=Ziziphus jujuba TaxID=326968 RepID=A0A6P3ZLM8_ZIZJJ|nr:uncharacterized protein LOC107417107 [Ziziphus jujuba]